MIELTNIDRFHGYFSCIFREGKGELLKYLERSGYFTSPSSGSYHCSYEGGNLEHSLNVTNTALKINESLSVGLSYESIIICGLFHDLGKASYYNKPQYVLNVLKGGKVSDTKPFETNKDRLNIPHEITSLHILSKFIQLTEDEANAIIFHNGLYTGLGYAIKGNERKLQQIIHFSDMYASRFIEAEEMPLEPILF